MPSFVAWLCFWKQPETVPLHRADLHLPDERNLYEEQDSTHELFYQHMEPVLPAISGANLYVEQARQTPAYSTSWANSSVRPVSLILPFTAPFKLKLYGCRCIPRGVLAYLSWLQQHNPGYSSDQNPRICAPGSWLKSVATVKMLLLFTRAGWSI